MKRRRLNWLPIVVQVVKVGLLLTFGFFAGAWYAISTLKIGCMCALQVPIS